MDVVLADDVDGDAMVLELRVNPGDEQPLVAVVQIGQPPGELRLCTFDAIALWRLREIVSYARRRLGAIVDTSISVVTFPGGPTVARASGDDGHASVDFLLEGSEEVLLAFWRDTPDGLLLTRVSKEMDVRAFEELARDAEGFLNGAG